MPLTHFPLPPFHAIHEIINMQLRRSHPPPLGPPSSKQGSSQHMRRRRPRNVGRATDNAPRAFSLFSLISSRRKHMTWPWRGKREDTGGGDRGKIAILTETRGRGRTPSRNYYPFPMPASERSPHPPPLPWRPLRKSHIMNGLKRRGGGRGRERRRSGCASSSSFFLFSPPPLLLRSSCQG